MDAEVIDNAPALTNLPGIPVRKRSKSRVELYPKTERPDHQKMYAYYEGLGPKRSLRKVAKEFNKSVQTLALVSKAFDWKGRLRMHQDLTKDPFHMLARPGVEKSRKDIVNVLCEITDIFSEMTSLAKDIRTTAKEEPDEDQKRKMKSLVNALSVYGISIRTPKDLRDMVGTLRDVMEFNKNLGDPDSSGKGPQPILINEMTLTIKDD